MTSETRSETMVQHLLALLGHSPSEPSQLLMLRGSPAAHVEAHVKQNPAPSPPAWLGAPLRDS